MIAPVLEIQLGKEMNEFSCKRLIDWSAVAANSALQSQVNPCMIAPDPCIWASCRGKIRSIKNEYKNNFMIYWNYEYGIISFHVYYLCFCKYIYTVEVNTFQASSEILLVSKENFCKVAHSSNKDSKMHIQLIILAG